ASEMFLGIITLILTLILYVLLRPIDKDLALLATFFSLVAVAVETTAAFRLVETLLPLGNSAYRDTFTAAQLATMSVWSIKTHGRVLGIVHFFLVQSFSRRDTFSTSRATFRKPLACCT